MNTSTETCPSLEDLAAFLDGRLSGNEQTRIVAHLADCPSCYEVFAEAARYRLDEEEDEEEPAPLGEIEVPQELLAAQSKGEVVPFPKRPIFRWVSSIAAILAVSLAAIPLYRQYYTMPQISSAQLASLAVSRKAPEDRFWSDLANRGGAPTAGLTVSHETLLGAHAFDLHLSLGRNDSEQALDDLAGINTHIEGIGFLPDQAKAYKEIQKQIYEGQPASRFIQKADELEASLPVEEDPYFAFGKWIEAGRLSALAQSPDFFQKPKNRKFLQTFLHHGLRDYDLDPKVAGILEDIQETLNTTAPSSLPYQDLREKFESILKHYHKQIP